jgi:predicted 2-oxoglutarate/Fe(II)-dependent dioxygenase YbiX
MSYFLNDNYEGGEIEFDHFNLKIKPKENQAVFFPSNYVYSHKVHPVTEGIRYSVVGWWE